MPDLEVGKRIFQAMQLRSLTQSELAESLGVSQSAVSQWISGDKIPARANLEQLAARLGTTAEWLVAGRGSPPSPDLARERAAYEERVGWRFRPEPADQGRDYGNANQMALTPGLKALVRESGQNSIDERVDTEPGVGMEFRVIRLRGEALRDFLRAIHWGGHDGLEAHLKGAASSGQKLATILQAGLDDLDQRRELLLLRVDDWGARGLVGSEFGEGNFAALTRNNLDSAKQGLAGGSNGIGKGVFWRASRLGTVLIRSDLYRPQTDADGYPRQDGRIIGRADLPWHELSTSAKETRFAGPGWFGEVVSDVARSVWDNHALAHDLYLDREAELGSGTSVLVTGFYDPAADADSTMESLTRTLGQEVIRNFWPAMESGHLDARASTFDVATLDHREPASTVSIRVESEPAILPFVHALRAFRQRLTGDRLEQPGDVSETRIPLKVPRRKASPDKHPGMDHDAVLLVRRADDAESLDFAGQIAYFRGREMIIRYDRLNVPSAFPFHAVVLCGEATGEAQDDIVAERFLRLAEPPAHDDWRLTPELKTQYVSGSGAALRDFFGAVREEVRRQVRPPARELDEGPAGLRELLRLTGSTQPPATRPLVRATGKVDSKGAWDVNATVRLPDARSGWRVEPILVFTAETGGGTSVQWSAIDAQPPCTVEGSTLVIPPGIRDARFHGVSDPESHPAPAADCAVRVDLRFPRREISDGSAL